MYQVLFLYINSDIYIFLDKQFNIFLRFSIWAVFDKREILLDVKILLMPLSLKNKKRLFLKRQEISSSFTPFIFFDVSNFYSKSEKFYFRASSLK